VNSSLLSRAVLITVFCIAMTRPARADLQTDGDLIIAGIVVVSAAVATVVTILVIHHKSHHAAVTGCVTSGAKGMTLTDDKDKRTYTVTGNAVGLKAGERMTLEGKRRTPVFEARSVVKDFGVCQP